jgi:radical SAM protein (TIGR01212 family)
MALSDHITTFGQYLKEKYGEKIYKLSLHADVTCPNRDGTKGIGGCIFCNNKSFFPNDFEITSVTDQVQSNVERLTQKTRAKKFIAYFQAYSNTYGELQYLQRMYLEALNSPCVMGLCIGTRPDCLTDDVLALLNRIQGLGYEVWVELGLQSSHNSTLEAINRGHTYEDYLDAINRCKLYSLNVCTHLIAGLPGETKSMVLDSWYKVRDAGVQGVKWHPLHVVKGTQLARLWKNGKYQTIEREEYIDIVGDALRETPSDVIVHRVMSTITRKDLLLGPHWTDHRWPVMNGLEDILAKSQRQQAIA